MSRIVRQHHEKNYTCISNDALRDPRLGWAARGLLAYLLSRPDDWTVILGELIAASPDGRARVERALDELTTCGYLEREITRARDGRRSVSSTVWERAQCWFAAAVIPLRQTDMYEVPKDQSSQSETSSGPIWDFLTPDEEVEQLPLYEERSDDVVRWLRDRDRLHKPIETEVPALRAASHPPERGAHVRDVGGTDGPAAREGSGRAAGPATAAEGDR